MDSIVCRTTITFVELYKQYMHAHKGGKRSAFIWLLFVSGLHTIIHLIDGSGDSTTKKVSETRVGASGWKRSSIVAISWTGLF